MTIGRTIPAQLVTHFLGSAQTWTRLLRFTPVGVTPFGITTHDVDLTYDANDGVGAVVYRARRGYVSSAQVATSDLSVDNSEAEALLAEFALDGITFDMIRRGVMDDAQCTEFLVNYNDLTTGRHVVLGSGTVGEIRAEKGLSCYIEQRSKTQTLKQNSVIELGSITCRAQFGDARCGFDAESEWNSFSVVTVGAESDRVFTIAGSGVIEDTGYYVPGVVKFTNGDNADRTFEIEAFEVNSNGDIEVTLKFPTDEPILDTDEGEIRRECSKHWTGHNSCDTYWGVNKGKHFRGEPHRPVADSASLMAPGGASGGSNVGAQQVE